MWGDHIRSSFPTGVFWSLEDCPIPEGLNPSSIYENIKKALGEKGYDGALSIKAYGDKEQFTDAQIELIQGESLERESLTLSKKKQKFRMSCDSLLWAVDNYKGANFLFILNAPDTDFIHTLERLKSRAYVVFLAQPEHEVASEFLLGSVCSVWLSTSLLEDGFPFEISGIRIVNFDEFNSPEDLEALGTVRLKIELKSRGMKCGGTLQARAARLFLLKSTPLDKLPKKFLTKNKKDNTFGCAVFDLPSDFESLEAIARERLGDAIAGNTGVYWDHDDLAIAGAFNPFHVRDNLVEALAMKNMIGFLQFYFYVDKEPIPDYLVERYEKAKQYFVLDEAEAGAGGKSARVKVITRDMLTWALDAHCFGCGAPANLMLVSNTISQEPEMISFLQAVQKRNISVLLVYSDKMDNFKEVDMGDIPTENFDWLWSTLIHGGKPIDHTSPDTEEEAEPEPEQVSRVIHAEEEAVAQPTEEEALAQPTEEEEEETLAEQLRIITGEDPLPQNY